MSFFSDIKKKAKQSRIEEQARRSQRTSAFKKQATEKIGGGIGKVLGDPFGTLGKGGKIAGKGIIKGSKLAAKGFEELQKRERAKSRRTPTRARASPRRQQEIKISIAPSSPMVKKVKKKKKDPFSVELLLPRL